MTLEARALRAVHEAVRQGRLKALSDRAVVDTFLPLARRIPRDVHGQRPLTVAISGPPGTGKTTLAAHLEVLLEQCFGLRSARFSLDDLYFGRDERAERGRRIHPLLATRGVPGTHRVELGLATVRALCTAAPDSRTPLPRFSKVTDDPWPSEQWPTFIGRPDIILIDAWFWQLAPVTASELQPPCNEREATEDADGAWRAAVNRMLGEGYPALFDCAQLWIRLLAPSWEASLRWRVEQDADNYAAHPSVARPADDPTPHLRHFLYLFQRWAVQEPVRAPDVVVRLNEDHSGAIQAST